jgi:nucleoside-diphosphate-sugar epimerase
MAKILVTGGAGYIGSTLVPSLLEAGHRVWVLDRFYFGRESLQEAQQRYGQKLTLVQGDVRGVEQPLFEDLDAVVDLAGISNDPACELDAQLTEAINYRAALRVASMAHYAGVKRLIFASSCSVYGSGATAELSEESELNPVSLYAKCKARVEKELLELSAESDLCVTALRLATVFGLSKRMRFDLAVNLMTRNAYLENRIRVTGGGRQWRPFVHVRDVAAAVMRVLDSPEEKVRARCFNVGSDDQNFQMRNLAYRVRDRIPEAQIEVTRSDPDNRSYNVRFSRIREELDYKTQYTIEHGVDEIREALASGSLDPDDRRWYTLRQYLFLDEVERVHREVAHQGMILRIGPEGG